MQTCVLILKAKTSVLVTRPVLQLPAPEADCAAVYWSLGTAQSTATCRPANGKKNHFPKWDGPGAAFLSHNSKVKCLSLTFDLFEIQSIKCSCCTGHVFKLDKCKSSHLPIYIIKKKQFLSDSHGNSTACSFQKFKTIFTRFEGNFSLKNCSKLGTNLLQIILRALKRRKYCACT